MLQRFSGSVHTCKPIVSHTNGSTHDCVRQRRPHTRVAPQIAHGVDRTPVAGDAIPAQFRVLDRTACERLGRGIELCGRQVGVALHELDATLLRGRVQQVCACARRTHAARTDDMVRESVEESARKGEKDKTKCHLSVGQTMWAIFARRPLAHISL